MSRPPSRHWDPLRCPIERSSGLPSNRKKKRQQKACGWKGWRGIRTNTQASAGTSAKKIFGTTCGKEMAGVESLSCCEKHPRRSGRMRSIRLLSRSRSFCPKSPDCPTTTSDGSARAATATNEKATQVARFGRSTIRRPPGAAAGPVQLNGQNGKKPKMA